jgi:hypothetical protein
MRSPWSPAARARRHARKLAHAESALRDAAHHYDEWVQGWSLAPSRVEAAREDVHRLIRLVYNLGGDPAAHLRFRQDYMLVDALPGAYARVPDGFSWEVVPRSTHTDAADAQA